MDVLIMKYPYQTRREVGVQLFNHPQIGTQFRIEGIYGVPKSPRRKPKHEARRPAQGQSSAAGDSEEQATGCLRRATTRV